MKTPYDTDEAKRWFVKASKAARAAIKKVAEGDETAVKKARRERDKMSELLRWFYDDKPYWEQANAEDDAVRALLTEAHDLGYAARQRSREEEISRLRDREREREARLSPELRQYKKELAVVTARDILRGAKR